MKRFLAFSSIFAICLLSYGHNIITSNLPVLFGVEFGSSYELAEVRLESKFGKKSIFSDENCIDFMNVSYGGMFWSRICLNFQRGTYRSYLNRIYFVSNATSNISSAKDDRDYFLHKLMQQYGRFDSYTDENGFKYYVGGPIIKRERNGKIEEIGRLICIDIIKYNDGKYAARIDYGIIPFVEESF